MEDGESSPFWAQPLYPIGNDLQREVLTNLAWDSLPKKQGVV